jgi:hypothetical protein
MTRTSAAAAEERLTQSEVRNLLRCLAADYQHTFPPPPRLLPKRPLTRAEWQEVVELLSFRAGFAEPAEAPRATDAEPGSEEKVRELRRRFRQGVSLFCPRDRQLPASQHAAAGAYRAIAKLGDAAREAARRVASARATACARKNGVAP